MRHEARSYVRQITDMMETQRVDRFTQSLSKNEDKNMKKLYNFIKFHKKSTNEKFLLKNEHGEVLTDDKQIQQQVRTQWDKIYEMKDWTKAKWSPPPDSMSLSQIAIDELQNKISKKEVEIAIKDLRAKTSAGSSDIPPEFIVKGPDVLTDVLLRLFQQMWDESSYPSQAKDMNSIFLHKKGPTDTLDNYRTITTGCNICKVFLRILLNRISAISEEANLLGEIQTGFRKYRRGSDNILLLDTMIRKARRSKKKYNVALLDLTKAYDRVCRPSLLYKLAALGFPQKIIELIEELYREPNCVVKFQSTDTTKLDMPIGLRQGCVLSPYLFNIYLSHLGRELEDCGLGMQIDDKKNTCHVLRR